MAIAASFPEANVVLNEPDGMTVDQCDVLNVCRAKIDRGPNEGQHVVISCWKLTAAELEEVNRTGRVWLMVWGQTMPPASVVGQRSAIFPTPEPPVFEQELQNDPPAVFSHPDCPFNYCDQPAPYTACQDRCQYAEHRPNLEPR